MLPPNSIDTNRISLPGPSIFFPGDFSRRRAGTEAPDWKKLFEQAVLETNNEVLPQELASAERALTARLRELNLDHGGTPEEQKQLRSALKALDILRSERLGS